eukprot:8413588-Pyramimonas_sp.AAC.1
MTEGKDRSSRQYLSFLDVRRAHFHAPATREVYVQLPPEDASPGMVGRLNMSMYGTRDAALNWESKYTAVMKKCGFEQG